MQSEAVQKYCGLMAEIKKRTAVIDAFTDGIVHAVYKATTIESIYLQFRKVLELIALGSLVANKDVFSAVYQDFAKYWNAELLVKDIDDFLTKEDLIKLYQKCGAIMHSGNPYGSQVDFAYYERNISHWRERIVNLLNSHLVTLVDDPNVYLIQMGAATIHPTYTPFAPAEPPRANA